MNTQPDPVTDDNWPYPIPPSGPQSHPQPTGDDMPTPLPPPTPRWIGSAACAVTYLVTVLVGLAVWYKAGAAAALLLLALVFMFALARPKTRPARVRPMAPRWPSTSARLFLSAVRRHLPSAPPVGRTTG